MKDKKSVFVFRYGDMRLGGIQKIVYGFVKHFLAQGNAVVWIAPEKREVDRGFRKLINEDTITICTQDQAEGCVKQLCADRETVVVMLSFRPLDYLKMVSLERTLENQDVRNYLTVAHYKGKHLFLEEINSGKKKQLAFEKTKDFYQTLLDNRSLMFCSAKQVDVFEAHYGLKIDRQKAVLPVPGLQEIPRESLIRSRWGKHNIISVCRFAFPHKGYVLGLIRTYGQLKETFPDLKLTLVGFGEGTEQVNKEISLLPEEVQKDVMVIPGVPYEQLPEYYAQADVAVGLAGAASTSAAEGLITLIARHYCEDCETYGSYADETLQTISEEPGNPILPELERIFNMDADAYLEESRQTRRAYEQRVLPRLKDICKDYSVEKICPLTKEQLETAETMACRAEKWIRRNRYFYWLTHPQYVVNKLTGRLKKILILAKVSDFNEEENNH